MNTEKIRALLDEGVAVANIGVADFAAAIEAQQAPVIQVDWTPPPELTDDLQQLLDQLS